MYVESQYVLNIHLEIIKFNHMNVPLFLDTGMATLYGSIQQKALRSKIRNSFSLFRKYLSNAYHMRNAHLSTEESAIRKMNNPVLLKQKF